MARLSTRAINLPLALLIRVHFVHSLLGFATGFAQTFIKTRKWMGRFVQRPWLSDLKSDSDRVVLAYVMTNTREGERVLMYRGFLREFGLMKDGRFAYLTTATGN